MSLDPPFEGPTPDLTASAQAATFAARLDAADLPDWVHDKIALHVLDGIGCGLAGADTELVARVLDVLALEHGPGPCPVLGTSRSLPAGAAAFANATAINALDFDDGYEVAGTGMGHPGASIVAAALSAASTTPTTGATFLAAVAAGYEINDRLIEAMQPSHDRFRQVYGVGQHQSVGAAIACGRIFGLDPAAMANVLGFAGTLACVPSLRKYNWERRPLVSLKDFVAPAAEAGMRAVRWHQAGLTGAHAVLDGDGGLWRMLGSDRFDAARFRAGLGTDWRLRDNAFKAYPACRWMHPVLEAFAATSGRIGWPPDAIAAVVVHGSSTLVRDFMDPAPATMVDAQFSLPYTLAALAHGLAPAAAWYAPTTLERPDLRAFARRVRAEIDPELDALMSGPSRRPAGRVEVVVAGARHVSPPITFPLGGAERPLAPADVLAKFRANAGPVVGQTAAERLATRLLHLRAEPDVAALVRTCGGPGFAAEG